MIKREALSRACQESTNPYLYIAFVLAISTGMRQGELMNLRWEDIDLFKGRITLQQTKNGDRRVVHLRGLALQLLQGFMASNKKDMGLLFPSKEDPRKPMDLRFPWEQALRKANVSNYKWHDNRHSCASYLLMSGASLSEIAKILGHKTLNMVKRYSHISDSHASDVVEKMNKHVFSS